MKVFTLTKVFSFVRNDEQPVIQLPGANGGRPQAPRPRIVSLTFRTALYERYLELAVLGEETAMQIAEAVVEFPEAQAAQLIYEQLRPQYPELLKVAMMHNSHLRVEYEDVEEPATEVM